MDDWRDIPGFPNYMINAYGNLYNKSQDSYPNGAFIQSGRYYRIKPGDIRMTRSKPQSLSAHRLVAMAFLGLEEGQRAYHKDGDKLNNHYSNITLQKPSRYSN